MEILSFLVCVGIMISTIVLVVAIGIKIDQKDKEIKLKCREKQIEQQKNMYFDELLKLQKLKEKNILTEEEFEREKEKIKPNN